MLRVTRFKMGNSLDRCCSCNDGASAKFPPKKLEPLRSQADQMMHVRPLPDFVKACHRLMNVRCLADVEPGGAPCAATLWTPPSPFPVQGSARLRSVRLRFSRSAAAIACPPPSPSALKQRLRLVNVVFTRNTSAIACPPPSRS